MAAHGSEAALGRRYEPDETPPRSLAVALGLQPVALVGFGSSFWVEHQQYRPSGFPTPRASLKP